MEVSPHTKGWIYYLQDTRNEMLQKFIAPVLEVIKSEVLTAQEKIDKIGLINQEFKHSQMNWNPKEYGVNVH